MKALIVVVAALCLSLSRAQSPGCTHHLYIPFDQNTDDYQNREYVISGGDVNAGQTAVSGYTGAGYGEFPGTMGSSLIVPRFANFPFPNEMWISFRFLEDTSVVPVSGNMETLVTNGACTVGTSFCIELDRFNKKVIATIVTEGSGKKTVSADYSAFVGQWKSVSYVYDGRKLRLTINDNNTKEVSASGNVVRNMNALYIGAEFGTRRYDGLLDELFFYLCL